MNEEWENEVEAGNFLLAGPGLPVPAEISIRSASLCGLTAGLQRVLFTNQGCPTNGTVPDEKAPLLWRGFHSPRTSAGKNAKAGE